MGRPGVVSVFVLVVSTPDRIAGSLEATSVLGLVAVVSDRIMGVLLSSDSMLMVLGSNGTVGVLEMTPLRELVALALDETVMAEILDSIPVLEFVVDEPSLADEPNVSDPVVAENEFSEVTAASADS